MLIFQDLRYALRMLRKSPGFTSVAVACLAIGIGANSTIFSLADGMWTRPLAVRNSGELVHLFLASDESKFGGLSYPEYEDLRAHMKTLAGLAVTQRRGPTLKGDGFAEPTMSNVVSDDYFTVLGVNAQVGRVFTGRDRNSGPVVVMGHSMWQRRFGGDPAIVGKTVRLGRAYTVVGVAPGSFRGAETWIDSDFWIPMSSWDSSPDGERAQRGWHSFDAIGRLRPGVSADEARAEFAGLARNLERAYPQFNKGLRGVLYSSLEYRLRSAGYTGGLLLAVVALVLLIACANVANLLVARAGVRSHEIGVRVAMGAGRLRLVRQLLTENLVIGVLGAAAGLFLATLLIEALPALVVSPDDTFTHLRFRMDSRVLLLTLAVSLLTVFVFGLFPAWRASRPDPGALLRNGSGPRHSSGRLQARSLLVIAQVALSMILLAGAGLLIRTFLNSLHTDLGFARKSLLVAEIGPSGDGAEAREFYRQLVERTRALPGVRQVTLARRPPLWGSEGGMAQSIRIPGRQAAPGEPPPAVKFNIVDRNYFHTLGIPLLGGRDFDEHDSPGAPKVIIVSETMARRFWPNEDCIGKSVHAGYDPPSVDRQVIGVAGDAHINSFQEPVEPYMYLPYAQSGRDEVKLLVETTGDPLRLANPVRQEAAALDRKAPVLSFSTLDLLIRSNVFDQQMAATSVSILGAIALFLAAIGLYGVMSYVTVRRTREIGIRMALGAQRRDALRLVLRQGIELSLIGIAVGVVGALGVTRLMAKMLYGIGPRDPLTFVSAAVLMVAVALAASYVPAWRATRVDPVLALRYE